MKTVGKFATIFLVVVVVVMLAWVAVAGFQGKTLKDTLPEQKTEVNVDQGDINDGDENTEGTEEEPEATQVAYDAEREVLFVG